MCTSLCSAADSAEKGKMLQMCVRAQAKSSALHAYARVVRGSGRSWPRCEFTDILSSPKKSGYTVYAT